MRKTFKIALSQLLLIFLAYHSGSAQTIDLKKLAVKKLHETIKSDRNDAGVELKDDHLYVDGKLIKISTTVENDLVRNGVFIFAVKFDTSLAGDRTFSVGSIGVGKDRNDAIETSVNEWVDYFGKAFARMLAGLVTKTTGDLEFYPGFMGVRGELPEGWLNGTNEMHDKFINVLTPLLRKTTGDPISVSIMVTNSDGVLTGECRINNEISTKLLDELKKLDWRTDKSFIFKQFYLVKRQPVARKK